MADEARPELKVDTRKSTTVAVNNVNRQTDAPFGFKRVSADKYERKKLSLEGLSSFTVAAVSEPNLSEAFAEIRGLGGVVTSSGGLRDLKAPVDKAARSATSFHYTGRAIDLYIYSGMIAPETDAYVVVVDDEDGFWQVFARTEDESVSESTLIACKKVDLPRGPANAEGKRPPVLCKLETMPVVGRFFSVTDIFESHGFKRIPAKSAFTDDPKGRLYDAAEWWHFEDHSGLEVGKTTFGEVLLQVRTKKELEGTPPAAFVDNVWNGKTFG